MDNFLIGLLIELHSKNIAPNYVPLHILARTPEDEFNMPTQKQIEACYTDFNNIEQECTTENIIDYALRTYLYDKWRRQHEN